MTEQFFTIFKARLSELVADLRFEHQPTGQLIAPQVIDIMLPRPTEPVPEGDEYPFVRWLVYRGEFERNQPTSFSVLIDGGVFTSGSVVDGAASINKLCMTLGGIVHVPRFSLYRLSGPVRFIIGDPASEEQNPGLQPHPYHHCRLLADFDLSGRS